MAMANELMYSQRALDRCFKEQRTRSMMDEIFAKAFPNISVLANEQISTTLAGRSKWDFTFDDDDTATMQEPAFWKERLMPVRSAHGKRSTAAGTSTGSGCGHETLGIIVTDLYNTLIASIGRTVLCLLALRSRVMIFLDCSLGARIPRKQQISLLVTRKLGRDLTACRDCNGDTERGPTPRACLRILKHAMRNEEVLSIFKRG
ncbi:hypothetical protein BJ170DRAFT_592173 [Xylariales sp. AK1849]|nr:hypothetical protein BJ170DRAFT_592173 [Xylariales sp. AK1849]